MSLPKINHTQVSNDFIDKWLPVCDASEVKVFIVIARHTIGWHRDTAELSLSRIETLTGMSRHTVCNATKTLQAKGIITKTVGRMAAYTIDYDKVESVDKSVDNCGAGAETAPDPDGGSAKTAPENAPSSAKFAPKTGFTGAKIAHIERKGKDKEKRKVYSQEIQREFRDVGSEYYHDGREARATSDLSDRFGEDPVRFRMFVRALKTMRETDKFYRGMPMSPSTLNTFWNAVAAKVTLTVVKDMAHEETRMANGMTTKEYMEQVEKERRERSEA